MMHSSRLILIGVALIALFNCPATAQQGTIVLNICSNGASYANGSTYAVNLKDVLSLISANNLSSSGFYNISVGQNTDKVNAVGLCRGDISLSDCYSCLNFSASDLYARCPTQREAIAWYDNCMFRYSDQSIFGTLDTVYHTSFNPNNVSNPDQFSPALSTLLSNLRDEASLGNSTRKFAVGYTNYTNFGRVYALVQCTPDLSGQLCGKCLDWAFKQIPEVSVKQGGRAFCGSCSMRYEIDQFYVSLGDALLLPPSTPPPSNVQGPKKSATHTRWKKIIIALATIGFICFIVAIVLFVNSRRKRGSPENADEVAGTKCLEFDFETLKTCTDNFSDDKKLGQGGFGAVYQGKLDDGQQIAVKRLSLGSERRDIEFKNEVFLLTKLQHKNLVRLLGFCLKGKERLLIYELVANASLDRFLFDPPKRIYLDWERRYKIIRGVARGLRYLHEDSRLRIIHRDLKASNILLDEEMHPKIADFGMARLFIMDQTQGSSTTIVGTYGYMAPEYAMHGQYSVKSDVYSFGMLMLELVCGQKISCFRVGETMENLTSFAWDSWRAGSATNMIDPTIINGPINDIMRCIHIGLLCVQESATARPTMTSVELMLSSLSLTLPLPSEPAFYVHSTVEAPVPADDRSPSINYVSISEMDPR